jgi:CheY-like chemotaxis protein
MEKASLLLVDSDAACGRAIARVLRQQGSRVQLCRTRAQAVAAARRQRFDCAIVDLFVDGGGVELARLLARQVPRVILSLGMGLEQDEILEIALGFPVHRKAKVPALLGLSRVPGGASNDRASAATLRESPPPSLAATAPSPAPRVRAHGRGRAPQ